MTKHSIKARLDNGDIVRVMSIGALPNPKLIEMVGLTGDYHGVWIDQEHAFVSHSEMELLLMACRATGMDAFARVPPTDYATIMRPMETGCSGIMIAQVRTVDQVRQALQWAKYPPVGVRGLFLGNAECGYGAVSAGEQVERANRDRWLSVQIETTEALDCIDELVAIDGVDMLFVGPADLSSALGVPGQVLHERCVEALQRVSHACRRAGKPWGTLSRTPEHANIVAISDASCLASPVTRTSYDVGSTPRNTYFKDYSTDRSASWLGQVPNSSTRVEARTDNRMPRIGIASKNRVKAQAILRAFQQLFPAESFEIVMYDAASGVSDQPMSDEETRRGAENRMRAVRDARPDCDFWAAIEGGVEDGADGMSGLAWIVVSSRSTTGCARTATFPLPPRMATLVRNGTELGLACDQLYDTKDTKHREGAIGLLSHQTIDRQQLYQHAAVMALLPLKNPEWYLGDT